jgi:class 3 adenylate cyclase
MSGRDAYFFSAPATGGGSVQRRSGGERTSQTRGFVFADLRGYTAFTERHGDQAARELLAG